MAIWPKTSILFYFSFFNITGIDMAIWHPIWHPVDDVTKGSLYKDAVKALSSSKTLNCLIIYFASFNRGSFKTPTVTQRLKKRQRLA
jgi:hypothetical protein